jgi:RimJ/RimL family protein N-acetyltransferase
VNSAPIEGAAVLLRSVERDVARALLDGHAPAAIVFAPGYPSPFSLEVMELLAGARAAEAGPGFRTWFVVRRDDGAVAGEIGYGFDAASGSATVGYSIVEPCWGRGYATDALLALLARLREDPSVLRIEGKAPVAHVASRRVMEKAGMALCDTRLEEVDGELVELAVYRLVD